MSRLSRINTIWLKELRDTLRDRRTLLAMVLVPMVLYPALMLGSLQAFELQMTRLKQESYTVGVTSEGERKWLQHVIETDPARRVNVGIPAEDLPAGTDPTPADPSAERPIQVHIPTPAGRPNGHEAAAQADLFERPQEFQVIEVKDLHVAVRDGKINLGLRIEGALPTAENDGSAKITMVADQTDPRATLAMTGLSGIFVRKNARITEMRLRRAGLEISYVQPLVLAEVNTAPPEKMGASVIAQIVPLILIIMTITGAIYPAIDLTAGERERNTLETLMVAPVPSVDLIAGKFVVVALVGMLSAGLNLLSIAGTIYLSGVGNALMQGKGVSIPLHVLPWVFVVLLPLAVLFSAALLAVCSFARSFKEAQNYVMPVMMAALIPAIVGILPGTRLEGPLQIMPVTNIVLLTRDLFLDIVNPAAIFTVFVSTSIYAGAAVAIAARLFGQEAVQFADSSSIRTLFMRRFFKPADRPTTSQALLLLAIAYSINIFWQQALHSSGMFRGLHFFEAVAAVMLILFVALPMASSMYLKLHMPTTFSLNFPPPRAWLSAFCIGLSTWILALGWYVIQERFLPMPEELEVQYRELLSPLAEAAAWKVLLLLAVIPAMCEEFFFRGFALSGLKESFGKFGAVAAVALAFGISHQSIFRLPITITLGIVLGALVLRFGSLFPAMLVHMMHNGLSYASQRDDLLAPYLAAWGWSQGVAAPPGYWLAAAATILTVGLFLMLWPTTLPRAPEVLSGRSSVAAALAARTGGVTGY